MMAKKKFKIKIGGKKMQIFVMIAAVLAISLLSIGYLTMTGFVTKGVYVTEKTVEIEVWASTSIDIEAKQNIIQTQLLLDDETPLSNQEIEFYLDDSLFTSETTDSEGYAQAIFNLSNTSPGTYSLELLSQGSSDLYINPLSTEKQVEIIEKDGTLEIRIIEEIDMIEIPEGMLCQEFSEYVLWSSGYSQKPQGSVKYEIWTPKYNCSELNVSDCFLGTLEVKTRFLYFENETKDGEGYIQISNPDESICNNPKEGTYSRYLAYETLRGEAKKFGQYCGKNKNPNAKCGVEITDSYDATVGCYGIKAYANQNFIVDVFGVDYTLCWENGGINET